MRPAVRLIYAIAISASVLILSACSQPMNKTQTGTLGGTALGAGLGAIIGNQTGHPGAGVAIGAAAGALSGALIGNTLQQTDEAHDKMRTDLARQKELLDENQRLIEELKRRGADVRTTERGVVVNLPDILFKFDSYELTRDARLTVAEIAEVLETIKDREIAVEGHTDSIGTVVYNKDLSMRRADAVARELIVNGVSRKQLKATGFGEGKPIATNNTDVGRGRNRRVEVIIEN